MICTECRNQDHQKCPEIARQADPEVGKTEKIGSSVCYCHHREQVCTTTS